MNRAFETRFGLRSEETLGRQLGDFLGTDQIEQQRPYIDAALSERAVRFGCPMPKKGLGTRITEVDYTPHFEGGMVRGFFVLLQDITEKSRRRVPHPVRTASEILLHLFPPPPHGLATGGIVDPVVPLRVGAFELTAPSTLVRFLRVV